MTEHLSPSRLPSAPAVVSAPTPAAASTAAHVLPDQFRQTLRWAWRILWRGKYIILGCWLLAIVPTILILQQTQPLYTATATVVVEGPEASDPLSERFDPRMRLTEPMVRTEVEVASSTLVAKRAIERLNLMENPEFNPALRRARALDDIIAWINPMRWLTALADRPPPAAADDPAGAPAGETAEDRQRAAVLAAFRGRLDVQMHRRAFIITITFTSQDRALAALAANTVAELYVLDRLEASLEEARRMTQWLGSRLETLRQDVATAEAAAEQYRATHGLRRRGDRQTVTDQQLSEINSRLVVARTELAQMRARLARVQALVRSEGSLETASDVLQAPLIQRLREQETALQRQVSEGANVYGPRHPTMIALRADLAELRKKIASEIEKIAGALANDVQVAAAGVQSMEAELARLTGRVDTAGEAEVRLRELEREADTSRELYEALLARFKRTAEQDRIARANARVVSPAEVPRAPSFPRKNVILTTITFLALSAGLLLVFVLDRMDNAVRSSDEAEEITGLPTVAIVPALGGRGDALLREVVEKPRSQLADAVRSLRISLDLNAAARPGRRARIVVITSSIPKEGKTFVAMGLGLMCTRTGEKVLLIDGDVHRPRLHTIIQRPNDQGFVQLLAGTASPEQVIQAEVMPGFDFLPAGTLAQVADLVSEARGEAVLADLATRYDRIIIDTAPVLAVADARVLGRLADQMLYLVRWNATPRDAVRNGVKLLREAGAPLHGVVLSQVNQRKHARYAYGDYGQYYGRYRSYYGD